MKLSPSIISGLSLSAAVATFGVGTASANNEVPSESPSDSSFPNTITDHPTPILPPCGDSHEDIVDRLFFTFGEENCAYISNKSLECVYTDPNWFQGYAKYDFTEAEISYFEYRGGWQPKYLMVSDTNLYDYSGANWINFDEPEPEGFYANCMNQDDYLYGIWYKRWFPQYAPVCDDTVGEFTVQVGGEEKTKTCDDYWKQKHRTRREHCSINEVASNCPGICTKFDFDQYNMICVCKDNPFPFGKNDLMCADLEGKNADELTESCNMKPYRRNCPSFCKTLGCTTNF